MRKVNDMYHIEGETLIKTSNNEPVPEDEPLFILRGRDGLAGATILAYYEECADNGVPTDRLEQLQDVIAKFLEYRRTHPTKMPGVTHGN